MQLTKRSSKSGVSGSGSREVGEAVVEVPRLPHKAVPSRDKKGGRADVEVRQHLGVVEALAGGKVLTEFLAPDKAAQVAHPNLVGCGARLGQGEAHT